MLISARFSQQQALINVLLILIKIYQYGYSLDEAIDRKLIKT